VASQVDSILEVYSVLSVYFKADLDKAVSCFGCNNNEFSDSAIRRECARCVVLTATSHFSFHFKMMNLIRVSSLHLLKIPEYESS
jgi:hypothetical protein